MTTRIVTAGSVLVRDATLPTTAVDTDLVILNLATNTYVGLDAIGTTIWDLLATPITAADVCTRLAAGHAGAPATITAEAMTFLQEMVDEELVRVVAD